MNIQRGREKIMGEEEEEDYCCSERHIWNEFKRVAIEERRNRTVKSSATSMMMIIGGVVLGNGIGIVPIFGGVIGGFIGMIASLFVAERVLDTNQKMVFSQILAMDEKSGIEYASYMYERYDNVFTSVAMFKDIVGSKWDEQVLV